MEWREGIPKEEKRNFWLFTIDGTFFYMSQAIFDASVIVPAFLSYLTGSPFLIGLGTAIRHAGWLLPQLLVAGYVERKPLKKPTIILGILLQGLAILAIVPVILLFFHDNPTAALVLFLTLFAISSIGDGISGVPWTDVLGKTIGATRRGRLMGYMQTLGGLAAFGCGGIVAWVLSRDWIEVPYSYCILMLLAFACIMGSVTATSLFSEPRGVAHQSSDSLMSYMKRIPEIIKGNTGLKRLLAAKLLAGFFMLPLPFYVTYARDVLGTPDVLMGAFIGAQMLGGTGGSIILGYVGDHFGNRIVILLAIAATLFAPVAGYLLSIYGTVFPSWLSISLLLLIYMALGIAVSGSWLGFQNYLLELVDPSIRPTCVGLSNTIVAPVSFAPLLGGYIVGAFGYSAVFGLTAILVLASFVVALGLGEPRSARRSLVG